MKLKNFLALVAGGLLFTACSNENVWDYDGSQSGATDEYVDVTFNVTPEALGISSRAGSETSEGGPGAWQTLSKGKKIDMLIYSVYDENLHHLTQYGEGFTAADGLTAFTNKTPALSLIDKEGNFLAHHGQTVVNVGDILAKGDAYTITIRLMRKKQYTIAFWAQSSQTTAYDTDDLRHVEVFYKDADGNNFLNNDETRDAFCKSETFTVADGGNSQTILLTRPLAQINVGTTGADYKNLEIGNYTGSTHRRITQSKIEIKGVARYLDVVTNKVLTKTDIEGATDETSPYYGVSGEATTDVVFDWATIPAYYKTESPAQDLYLFKDGEELLSIDLNQDGNILGYKTSYPTLGSKGSYMTEAFKYLSMAYVLVAAPTSSDASSENGNLNNGVDNSKVINNVTVWFGETGATGNVTNDFQSLTVPNVPARTNWRTNILGGLRWMKDPTDHPTNPDPTNPDNPYDDPDYPDNPDPDNPYNPQIPEGPDPSTIFNAAYLQPVIITDFFNDYNENLGKDETTEWK